MKKNYEYERAFVRMQNREIDDLIASVISVHTNFLKRPTTGTLRSLCELCWRLGYECARLSILRSKSMKG